MPTDGVEREPHVVQCGGPTDPSPESSGTDQSQFPLVTVVPAAGEPTSANENGMVSQ